jgi:signal transduction histidine kinase
MRKPVVPQGSPTPATTAPGVVAGTPADPRRDSGRANTVEPVRNYPTPAGSARSRPSRLPRLPWLLLPIPVALIQVFGVRGAAIWAKHNDGPGPPGDPWQQPGQGGDDVPATAYALALLGPVLLFALSRFPRTVIAATAVVAVVHYSVELPPGPVFLSPLVAMVAWFKLVRSERAAQAKRVLAAETARTAGVERLRIAQELHDVLAHHISLINVQAGVALHLVDEKPEQTRTALAAIKDASKESLTALRGALDALRHIDDVAPRRPTAGLAQLETVVASVRTAGVEVRLRVSGERVDLEPAADLAALRIVQESLTNVLRHSGAAHVEVDIEYRPESLRIRVSDNGRGGAWVPGNGLTGMAERAAALGGRCEAGPRSGGGFQVRAELPIG